MQHTSEHPSKRKPCLSVLRFLGHCNHIGDVLGESVGDHGKATPLKSPTLKFNGSMAIN